LSSSAIEYGVLSPDTSHRSFADAEPCRRLLVAVPRKEVLLTFPFFPNCRRLQLLSLSAQSFFFNYCRRSCFVFPPTSPFFFKSLLCSPWPLRTVCLVLRRNSSLLPQLALPWPPCFSFLLFVYIRWYTFASCGYGLFSVARAASPVGCSGMLVPVCVTYLFFLTVLFTFLFFFYPRFPDS